MGNWSTGLKLALSVLGVVLFATAIQTFVNWQPSSKFGAGVFTIGAALVAGVIGAKFLPAGATAGLLTAGLALGGYQMVGDKVQEFGQNIGNSIRGTSSGTTPAGAKGPVGQTGQTGPAGIPTPFNPSGAVPLAGPTAAASPGLTQPQQVTIVQQAAKPVSDLAYLGGKLFDSVGTFLGGQQIFGGSKGDSDDAFAKVG